MRRVLVTRLALLVGLGLAQARSARAEARDGQLGSKCDADDPCSAPGLFCMLSTGSAPAASGPAGGLCTAPCLRTEDCRPFADTALCFGGICVEGCVPNTSFGEAFESTKCHGREDMGCDVDCPYASCMSLSGFCKPRCATDEQCGLDLFCNVATGECQAAAPGGDPVGSPCDPFASEPTCRGFCLLDLDVLYTHDRVEGVCVERCVVGAELACGTSPTNGVGAACLGVMATHGTGDLGVCAALCNCSSDCHDDQRCDRVELGGRFDALGLCSRGPQPPGAADCLSEGGEGGAASGCLYGAVRACRIDDCLGTAECLANGEYSACQCLPSGAGGASSVAAPVADRATRTTAGCRVGTEPSAPHGAALFACSLAIAVTRRARRRQKRRPPS
jgi:hypothetical protein